MCFVCPEKRALQLLAILSSFGGLNATLCWLTVGNKGCLHLCWISIPRHALWWFVEEICRSQYKSENWGSRACSFCLCGYNTWPGLRLLQDWNYLNASCLCWTLPFIRPTQNMLNLNTHRSTRRLQEKRQGGKLRPLTSLPNPKWGQRSSTPTSKTGSWPFPLVSVSVQRKVSVLIFPGVSSRHLMSQKLWQWRPHLHILLVCETWEHHSVPTIARVTSITVWLQEASQI